MQRCVCEIPFHLLEPDALAMGRAMRCNGLVSRAESGGKPRCPVEGPAFRGGQNFVRLAAR